MLFTVCFARDFAQLMEIVGSMGIVGIYPDFTLSPDYPESPNSPKLAGIKNNTRTTYELKGER